MYDEDKYSRVVDVILQVSSRLCSIRSWQKGSC